MIIGDWFVVPFGRSRSLLNWNKIALVLATKPASGGDDDFAAFQSAPAASKPTQ